MCYMFFIRSSQKLSIFNDGFFLQGQNFYNGCLFFVAAMIFFIILLSVWTGVSFKYQIYTKYMHWYVPNLECFLIVNFYQPRVHGGMNSWSS